MKVRAKHWLTYDGAWHQSGDVFEIAGTDADMMAGMVEIVETPVVPEEPKPQERPKRTRGKKG